MVEYRDDWVEDNGGKDERGRRKKVKKWKKNLKKGKSGRGGKVDNGLLRRAQIVTYWATSFLVSCLE